MKTTLVNLVMARDPSLAARLMVTLESCENNIVSINQRLRKLLYIPSQSTIDIRRFLEDDISDKEWLKHVKTHVVPFIIKYKLP